MYDDTNNEGEAPATSPVAPPEPDIWLHQTPPTRHGRPLFATIALVVMMVAMGGGIGLGVLDGLNAGAAVQDAVTTTLGDHSARIAVTITGTTGGQSFKFSGSGPIDFSRNAMEMTYTISVATQQLAEKVVYLGGNEYVSDPEISHLYPGKSWVESNLSTLVGSSHTTLSSAQNPKTLLRPLEQSGGTVTSLGISTRDSTTVQGYSVSLTGPELESAAKAELPKTEHFFKQLHSKIPKMTYGTSTYRVYVNPQGTLQSAHINTSVAEAQKSISIGITMSFSDYGASATISAPPATQVETFGQAMKKAGTSTSGTSTSGTSTSGTASF